MDLFALAPFLGWLLLSLLLLMVAVAFTHYVSSNAVGMYVRVCASVCLCVRVCIGTSLSDAVRERSCAPRCPFLCARASFTLSALLLSSFSFRLNSVGYLSG